MFTGGHARTLTLSLLVALLTVIGFGGLGLAEDMETQRLHPKLQRVFEPLIDAAANGIGAKVPVVGFSEKSPLGLSSFVGTLENDRVQILIEANSSEAVPALVTFVQQLEGTIQATHEQFLQAWVPVSMLTALAQQDNVVFVRQPVRSFQSTQEVQLKSFQGTTRSEGVLAIEANNWHQAGITGNGVKVGVIDTFAGYQGLLGRELPNASQVTAESFADHGEMANPSAPSGHGTAVSEIIHDIAPDAELFLTYFETEIGFRQAVDWLVDQDVDVINTSLGFVSGCFEEDGGIFEPLFKRTNDKGITWATASGNEADIHWMDTFTDPDEDGLHNYRGAADEGNTLRVFLDEFVYGDGRRVATSIISGTFAWEAPCGSASDDYELVIFRDGPGGELIELDAFDGSTGILSDWQWRPGFPLKVFFASEDFDPSRIGETINYHVGIRKTNASAPDADLDILLFSCQALCDSIQYVNEDGSVSIQEPSISSNVLTVGAAHHAPEVCSPSTCPQSPLLFYSSQGPTPFGTLKPEIVAPAHVSTTAFGPWTGEGPGSRSGFTGTSAASPHVAGAAALVKELFPGFNQADVISFLQERAEDLGDAGIDNVYGAGAMLLGQPPVEDRTAPGAPSNLTVTPSTWSNESDFTMDWTAPQDASQITAAWYKIGQAPTGRDDGTRSSEKPLTLSISNEGEQTVYLWLEDGVGNIDFNNRAQVTVRYDATAPTGTLRINNDSATTASSIVALSLNAQDNASGVSEMRFSSDGITFSDWEPFANSRNWDLEDTTGSQSVFAQFRDEAGNISETAQDDISLSFAESLNSGASVSGQIEAQSTSNQYTIDVPEGTAQMLIQARSQSGGDIDLYVRAGEPVDFGDNNVAADFASITPELAPTTQTVSLGDEVEGQAEASENDNRLSATQFVVDVEAGTNSLAVLLRSLSPGNMRLHIRYEAPVGWSGGQAVADWTSASGGGTESIVLMGAALAPGRYYIAIENLEPYAQSYSLSVNGS
jgi:hypothetical protein